MRLRLSHPQRRPLWTRWAASHRRQDHQSWLHLSKALRLVTSSARPTSPCDMDPLSISAVLTPLNPLIHVQIAIEWHILIIAIPSDRPAPQRWTVRRAFRYESSIFLNPTSVPVPLDKDHSLLLNGNTFRW